MLSSCVDDFEPGASSQYMDKIGYSVNIIDDSGEFKSRGESGSHVTVEKLDATIGDKELYLHTVVTDSIPKAITARKHGKALSRGSITEQVDELAVSAVVINGSDDVKGWPATGDAQMYMNNERVSEEYNWFTGRYWPQEHDSIRFYAYAPVDALNDETVDSQSGLPAIGNSKIAFYYKVDEDVEKQQDLLVSTAQYVGNYCKPAQINMSHALTAVEIQISEEVTDFTLTRLTVSNVKCDGLYTYQFMRDEDDDTNSRDAGYWSDYQKDKTTYVLYDNNEGLLLNGTGANMSYSGEEQNLLLMMIPQVLPDDAKITVEGRDVYGNAIEPLSAVIGGTDSSGNAKSWTKGQHVVYRLSFNPTRIEYVIEVVHSKENDGNQYYSPWHGESDVKFTVRSYRKTYVAGGEALIEPLEWEVDQSTIPAWVDHITLSGADEATCSYSVLPNLTSSTSHDILKNNTPRGTKDAPWDLSTNGGKRLMSTANCYMVVAPGWYTFPLVYGNAITDGADNPASYQGDKNGSGTLTNSDKNARAYFITESTGGESFEIPIKTLINFVGGKNQIETSWIIDANNRGGNVTPTDSKIVWQDEPCLVTDVHLNETKDYIIFRVPEVSINEGNAIISLEENASTKWSWHIWVTDMIDRCSGNGNVTFANDAEDINDVTLTNRFITSGYNEGAQTPSEWGSYKEYDFMLMHSFLGACDADNKVYTKTLSQIKFNLKDENGEIVQSGSGIVLKKDVLEIGIQGYECYMPDNAPYYQFGRKEPMIPGLGNNQDKPIYLNDRSAKEPLSDGGYQDKFGIEVIDGVSQGIDNGTVVDIKEITLGMAALNPQYFLMGLINEPKEEDVTTLVYQSWGYKGGSPDFFINSWDATFNDIPEFSYADVNNPVDFYNQLKKTLNKSVVKTVYDPCPVGYEMPRYDAFTGLTFEGVNVSPFLIEDVSDAAGYSFVNDVNIDGLYPSISSLTSSGVYHGLRFFTKTMPSRQYRSAYSVSSANDRLYVHALGHRSRTGVVASYNHFANALTATPLCARWKNENKLDPHYKLQGSRLCVIGRPNYSLRSISTSNFDLGFNIFPAKTGCNPSAVIVDNNNNVYWSDGNETNFSGSFD